MEDLSGKQLGQYRIVSPLGEGGMASVYKAYQPNMDRYVAIKILPPHYASDPNFVHRFSREAKVIAGLEHPNILPVYDFGAEQGYTYLVMRLVETGTLSELLQGRPMDLGEVEGIIAQIAEALDYAHARGVVHRDVKPSNVLIDPLGRCLLTDFGLAKVLLSVSMFTSSGTFLGTPKYASPEQCLGKELDQRSDIYSLGVILYEMVTGRPPFDAETPMGIVVKHIHDPLPMPCAVNPALPEAVERVILKALAKEPQDRYASAGELAKALKVAILESDSVLRDKLQARTLAGKGIKERGAFPVWGWVAGGILICGLIAGLASLAINYARRLIRVPNGKPELTQAVTGVPASAQPAEPTVTSSVLLPTQPKPVTGSAGTQTPLTPITVGIPEDQTNLNWQEGISFRTPGADPKDILRVGDEVFIFYSSPEDTLFRLNLQGEILSEIALSMPCDHVAWDGTAVWCAGWNSKTVYQLDPLSGAELSKLETDLEIEAMVWKGDNLWVMDGYHNLGKYDRTGKRLQRVGLEFAYYPGDLVWVGEELWLFSGNKVVRYDQQLDYIGEFSWQCGGNDVSGDWDGESLWVVSPNLNRVTQCTRVEVLPSSTSLSTEIASSNMTYQHWQVQTSFPAPVAGAQDVLVVGDQIWVIADQLYRLNQKGEILSQQELGVSCSKATWDGESIWCASDRLYQVDPISGKALTSFDPGMSLNIAWDGSVLWGVTSDANLFSYDRSGKKLKQLALAMPAGSGELVDMAWMGDKLVVTYWAPWTLVYDKEFNSLISVYSICDISSWDLGVDADGKSLWVINAQSNRITQCIPVD